MNSFHILFFGYSNLFRQRIKSILRDLPFNKISVAKHKSQSWESDTEEFIKYDSFEEAFECCSPNIVYISTINSSHFELALRSLHKGFHVIIDKPATLNFHDTLTLVNLAKSKGLLICEATVYLNHPQFEVINKLIAEKKLSVKHITLHFSFPPLNPDNFRYDKSAGGGVIYDTGPYIASLGRYFYKEVASDISILINESVLNVETSITALLKYKNNKSIMAFCSFNTEYINRINLIGENFLIDLDRVFTIPDNFENKIHFRSNNTSQYIITKKDNTFKLFFEDVMESLKNNDFQIFYNKMLIDSNTLQKIINKKNNKYGY